MRLFIHYEKYKHKITGYIAAETQSGKNYKVSVPQHFTIPKWIVEDSRDWELINQTNEVGKFYKHPRTPLLILIKELTDDNCVYAVGFGGDGEWYEKTSFGTDGLIEATKEEWLERLKEEAIKRGLIKDVRFKNSFSHHVHELNDYILFDNCLTNSQGAMLMESDTGKWATVVEDKRFTLTTHDGVELFEGDTFYFVDYYWGVSKSGALNECFTRIESYKEFSTKEKAEEYVEWNKPKYSLKNIMNVFSKDGATASAFNSVINELKKLNIK